MVVDIWYVVPCEEGKEQQLADSLKCSLNMKEDEEIFVFTYEHMKRYEGEWHHLITPLFPGYLFVQTEDDKELKDLTEICTGIQTISGDVCVFPLEKEAEEFLRELGGAKHHIPMSKGYIRGGITFVTEGPLCGKEKKIRKIDRHKRLARLDSPLERYQKKGFWTGLEIVSKS
ncbi:hypothetical protein B5F13_01155 [Drancourtella sp. An177]|nr:hypothetical protein B5F13_01155 [Drancourtella sp. An177]